MSEPSSHHAALAWISDDHTVRMATIISHRIARARRDHDRRLLDLSCRDMRAFYGMHGLTPEMAERAIAEAAVADGADGGVFEPGFFAALRGEL